MADRYGFDMDGSVVNPQPTRWVEGSPVLESPLGGGVTDEYGFGDASTDRIPEPPEGDDLGAGEPVLDAVLPEYEPPDPVFAPVAEVSDLSDALAAPDDDGAAFLG